jgi:hypothetical protein
MAAAPITAPKNIRTQRWRATMEEEREEREGL